MAAPSNSFAKVSESDPSAVTVTVRRVGPTVLGEVRGPAPAGGETPPAFSLGQDGSLGAHQALAVGCQLANELGRAVVVIDDGGNWNAAWGSLRPA